MSQTMKQDKTPEEELSEIQSNWDRVQSNVCENGQRTQEENKWTEWQVRCF